MKTLVKAISVGLVLCAANNAMAQQVTQEQKNGSAALVTACIAKKAPANWDAIVVAIDRTDPAKATLLNMAHIKGEKKMVDIDITGCDTKKQVNDLLAFQAVIPPQQAGWKTIYLRAAPDGTYSVFTDIALAEAQPQK